MAEANQDWERLHAEVERISSLGSWVWDVASDTSWWSDNVYRLVGLEPRSVEPSQEVFMAVVLPEDRARVMDQMRRVVEGHDAPTVEYRIRRSDGVVRDFRAEGIVMVSEGRRKVLGVVQDVTDLRVRERDLARSKALLVEAQAMAKVGSWVWVPKTGHIEISEGLRRIFGVEDDEPPTIARFLEMLHPDDTPMFTRLLANAEKTGDAPLIEVRVVLGDGTERNLTMVGRLLKNGDDMELAGIVHDVTDRRRLEERIRWSETLQALSRLASGIAHDFNNLLTVVLGHARVLQEKEPSEDLQAILQAAGSGAELTRRLLAFARESPAEVRPIVLEDQLADGVRMLARLVGTDFRIELAASGTPTPVLVDPAELHRVLLGLAENARDAMPQGGTLRITTTPKAREGEAGVELVFSDEGIGMNDATLRRATEPFFTTKGPGEGNGMGLAVVYGIIEQMNGRLELRSEPGQGTDVHIWLPKTDQEPAESDRPRREPTGEHRVVLVVEDEPLVRRLVDRVLTRAGYEVILAEGPDEAIEIASSRDIDVLLTDLTMPSGGGRRVATELREQRPDLPVLYMTGFSPNVDGLDAPVIFKPFRPDKLVLALDELLD